jgi:hypothetical protein
MNTVLHPVSVKETQYKYIMQHPTLGPKYKTGFGNEPGSFYQGIIDIQAPTHASLLSFPIPKYRKITYVKLF